MKNHSKHPLLLALLITGLGLIFAGQATAQTFTSLYNFTGGSDGGSPIGGVIQSGNTLYGTAQIGGSSGFGAVFAVNTDGSGFTNLYSFTNGTDGGYPNANLLLSGGVLYGTTLFGGSSGNGGVFSINPNGSGFTNIYSFTGGNDGSVPAGGLVISGNTLYGTTAEGGSSGDGVVFAVNTDGTSFANLHTFSYTDGSEPQDSLVLSGTTLYGTTETGGSSGYGTVFKVSTTGTGFSTMNNLNGGSTGAYPIAGLVLSGNTLYGATYEGGLGYGMVFKVNTSGSGFTTLYDFTGGSDGSYPTAGLLLSGSILYGTATQGGSGDGTAFSVSTTGTGFSTLYSFTDINDGATPDGGLILSGNTLYGTSSGDGSATFGSVFKINLGTGSAFQLNFSLNKTLDITVNKGNETDPAVAVNPNSSTNVFVAGVCSAITNGGLITVYTTNLTTWTTNIVAAANNTNGLVPALGQPSVAWDSNSNLFLAYIPITNNGIAVAVSTNGGKTFFPFTNLVPNDVTQYPRITAGVAGAAVGNVWLVYKDYTLGGTPLVAQGLVTTNIGSNGIGAFSSPEIIPGSAAGGFPDIAVGPSNQVMVAYQNNINSAATSQVLVSINANTTLTNGFGSSVAATTDAIGGLTYIPAEPAANGINAGVGLAWDENPASLYFGRVYLTYASALPGKPAAININLRYSVNNGVTWSPEAQVNDDTNSIYSHFLPRVAVDTATGSVALCWYDCRNDTGPSANQTIGPIVNSKTMTTNFYTNVFDLDGKANDDFMVYGTASLSGGAVFSPNVQMITPWNAITLAASNPPAGSFTYSSEAALADNANGLGHHIGLAYSGGNAYPVWADNSGFVAGNPDFPKSTNFDFYVGYSVLQTANLGIFVTVSPTNPISGESITYSVVVTNFGPFAANNISVTNILATNVTLVGQPVPAPNGQYSVSANGQTITFSYPNTTLAPLTSLTNTFVVSESQAGYVTNIASVGSSLPNPNPAHSITTNVVVVGSEDLAVSIMASPTNVDIGGTVNYTMVVSNLGPAANGLVYVTNVLTSNLAQVTNVVQSQGTCIVSNNTIIFSLGSITNQGVVNISYSATTLSTKSIIATNTAIVASTDFDTNSSNNISVATVTVLGEDLGLTMSAYPTNVNIGDTITYTLNVTNNGPSSSGILTLTNTLSSNLGQISLIQLPPGNGSVSKNIISFNMGALAVGQGITIVYSAVAVSVNAAATNALSTAVISSSDFDTNLVNNTALTIVTINGEDLAIGLAGSASTVPDGQPIIYTETVTNLGLSTNALVYVTNTLSTNLSNIAVLQSPGSYFINGTALVFQCGVLGVGQTASIVFSATPTSAGLASNLAVVASADFDTNSSNNSIQVLTSVVDPAAFITNFTVTAFGSAALMVWDTPFNANVQVAYGLTPSFGSTTSMSSPATHHVVMLTGLARDTNYYFSAQSSGQGIFFATNGTFATVDTLILNTGDASYTGSWLQGAPGTSNYYGSYFNVANTTPFNPTASAVYSPTIPSPGYYNVYAWYPQSTNFTTNAQMFAAGATNVIIDSVNQTINGGTWHPLATNLFFSSGMSGTVTIYNDSGSTNGLVAANAVKWAYNPAQDYPSNGVPPAWWSTFYFGTNTAAAAAYYAEYVFGTSPNDPSDTPDFWVTFPTNNTVMVTFTPYLGGRNYQLQSSSDLSHTNWITLTNQVSLSTDGNAYGVFTVNQTNTTQSFYRIGASVIP